MKKNGGKKSRGTIPLMRKGKHYYWTLIEEWVYLIELYQIKQVFNMNIHHLQAHVSTPIYWATYVSEHTSAHFGLVGARACPRVIRPSPFLQLLHDPQLTSAT